MMARSSPAFASKLDGNISKCGYRNATPSTFRPSVAGEIAMAPFFSGASLVAIIEGFWIRDSRFRIQDPGFGFHVSTLNQQPSVFYSQLSTLNCPSHPAVLLNR